MGASTQLLSRVRPLVTPWTVAPPGSSDMSMGILQARILEWVAKPSSHYREAIFILKRFVRSPAQVGCMRQVLRAGALGRPRGMGWGGRWEGGSGRGTHVNPWLIHVNVWQKPLQYCKVISLQLIKINGKKKDFYPLVVKN